MPKSQTLLTTKIAKRLLAGSESEELWEFTAIEDAAAEILSRYRGDLTLDSLTCLSDAAANSLSTHEGQLDLPNVMKLSDAAVKCLSKHEANLYLGITSLSDAAAKSLSKHTGYLVLRNLESLSAAAAKSLSKHKGGYLNLAGLTSLSNATAKVLSTHKGHLVLDNLTSLSDTAVKSLSKHERLDAGQIEDRVSAANKPKSKKSVCPISRDHFYKKAMPLAIKIGETLSSGDAREFNSGSLGWYFGEKVTVLVDGVRCKAQVTCSVVLVGSKDLPGAPPQDEE